MEVTIDKPPDITTQVSPLSMEKGSNEDVADQVRDIIYRNRKRNLASALRSSHPPKKSSLELTNKQDPRLQTKYGLNIKPPFTVHIEKIIHKLPSATQVWDSEVKETNN